MGAHGRRAGHRPVERRDLLMKNFYVPPQFEVVRDPQCCVNCKVCVEQCPNGVHRFDETHGRMLADESKCVDCQRCVAYCPTHALKI